MLKVNQASAAGLGPGLNFHITPVDTQSLTNEMVNGKMFFIGSRLIFPFHFIVKDVLPVNDISPTPMAGHQSQRHWGHHRLEI